MPYDGELDAQKGQILFQTVRAVASAISGPDPHMSGHSTRVAEYCDRIARSMGLAEHDRFLLFLTALFHDVGILSTPSYILRKPSALAEDEMEEVRVHPVKGFDLFAGEPALGEIARSIRHHHERVDGTGYPDSLRSEEIPLFSRIILVAETYEAMTHNRPYRRALSHEEALRRIQEGAGTQVDPIVVAHFLAVVTES